MTTAATRHEEHSQAQPRPGQVQGRVALVTGGTRGIGAAICRALAAEGADVAAGYWHGDEDVEKFVGLTVNAIDVPLEVARARLLARRVCTGCGRIYSVAQASGLETWTCGACGGLARRRADDTEEAVTRRLALYDEQTRPLLDWFGRRDQLLVVHGVGTSEEVFTRLLAGLWPRIPTDRIAQLAGVSEPVPTEPASSLADEDLSALAVEVVIEVPRGSRNKYEFDHERHVLPGPPAAPPAGHCGREP